MAAKLFNKLQSLLQRLAASVFFGGGESYSSQIKILSSQFEFHPRVLSDILLQGCKALQMLKKNDFSLVQCINYTNRAIPVFSEPWFCAGQRHPLVSGAQAPGNPIVQ